jgi:branched-chain amino acid aminotransferase
MIDRVVYVNGDFVPENKAAVSVMDWGFSGGDAAYEVTRTFGHKLFRLSDHLVRLRRSLRYLRVECSSDLLVEAAESTLQRNIQLLESPDDEYVLWHVVSRGDRRAGRATKPTVVVYCLPVDFARFARRYVTGSTLATAATRRIPPECLSVHAKLTNRANSLAALFEVRSQNARAIPLLLDINGFITETNSANFFFVSGEKLHTSRTPNILVGITRTVVIGLAQALGVGVIEGDFTPHDVYNASEAFTTSTSESIMPVRRLNGLDLPLPLPGPVTLRLIKAWNELTGIDIVHQAMSHLNDDDRKEFLSRWHRRLSGPTGS